mmetsp:Transcript_7049/g.6241  ORF Transcript_7049/g.6241 Transcript_7049/m.6241 type:complete len:124 (+) Transcript_7049:130-501(+)|eukprot:CAMPEP_0205808240 /NCGR_PEP_ID=MMETSP0205-20121125/12137_1 /ASSEMBLY_ACC=CAM_ASM_000278 /TAXON_ID=36767 /ORGANISM="Euplotes focardii, Strain TN1" /LENGTH=123 /DNA_ID=CAMNT_0053083607 /DNA_START=52 /DNA_END=423 /DNA_ORIENTATION=+
MIKRKGKQEEDKVDTSIIQDVIDRPLQHKTKDKSEKEDSDNATEEDTSLIISEEVENSEDIEDSEEDLPPHINSHFKEIIDEKKEEKPIDPSIKPSKEHPNFIRNSFIFLVSILITVLLTMRY